jgi:CHAD domain-containing protein
MRLRDLAALASQARALKGLPARKAPERIPAPAKRAAKPRIGAKSASPPPSAGRRSLGADLQSRANLASLGREWLRQLQVNARGALSSDAPEYVHQLRVGLRRLRCLYGVLMDVDAARSAPGRRAVADELRWIAGVLGEVRDLDVFAAELLPVAVAALPEPVAAALRQRVARMRSVRRKALRAALGSVRFGRLITLTNALLITPWQELPVAGHGDIGAMVAGSMNRRSTRARQWARRTDREAPEELHRLRIEIKKLRYLGEMIAPLHPGKQAREYLKAVTELQSTLGRMQDIATARQLIRRLAQGRADALSAVLPAMDAAFAEGQTAVLDDIMPAARKYRQAKAFWSDRSRKGRRLNRVGVQAAKQAGRSGGKLPD